MLELHYCRQNIALSTKLVFLFPVCVISSTILKGIKVANFSKFFNKFIILSDSAAGNISADSRFGELHNYVFGIRVDAVVFNFIYGHFVQKTGKFVVKSGLNGKRRWKHCRNFFFVLGRPTAL